MNKAQQKAEALKRMKELALYEDVISEFEDKEKIYYSEGGILYWLDNHPDWVERVREVEKENGILVYHAILSHMEWGDLLSLFYVSQEEEEWYMDHDDLKEGIQLTYNFFLHDKSNGSFGSIGFAPFFGGLKRTA